MVDERADVVEVPLLDGEHVGSEAKLYFQGKHPPSETSSISCESFSNFRRTNLIVSFDYFFFQRL